MLTHSPCPDKLRLLEAFANDQWIDKHYTEEQACELLLDRNGRLMEVESQMVEVRVAESHA